MAFDVSGGETAKHKNLLLPLLSFCFFLINFWSSVGCLGCVATVCAISTVLFFWSIFLGVGVGVGGG